MKKMLICFLLLFSFTVVDAQTKTQETKPPSNDTAKVLIMVVIDSISGTSATTWALRVIAYENRIVSPTQEDLSKDSFVVKKVKTPVSKAYYVPVVLSFDSVMTNFKTGKKEKIRASSIKYVEIPLPYVIIDFNLTPQALPANPFSIPNKSSVTGKK